MVAYPEAKTYFYVKYWGNYSDIKGIMLQMNL
jgi:hypothetical protein